MSSERVTLSINAVTRQLAAEAAERAGLSLSAWADRALAYYAVREGAPEHDHLADDLTEALADEHELAAADDEFHQRGAA
ncbi:hypothetical protein GCM10010466_39320 [Planomonospora alba]|uniref:Uncharacterized protein n=1 Tax=Planomonospora alba TaxID=161354 RepID=A0ABP6NF14_9ACTN